MNAAELDRACDARYEGNFLQAQDLMQQPNGVEVVIDAVIPPNTEKDATNKPIKEMMLAFKGAKKRLVVGKTNFRIIASQHGRKPSGWIGKKIKIVVRYLDSAFKETNVPTIRVMPPDDLPLPMGCRKWFGRDKPGGNLYRSRVVYRDHGDDAREEEHEHPRDEQTESQRMVGPLLDDRKIERPEPKKIEVGDDSPLMLEQASDDDLRASWEPYVKECAKNFEEPLKFATASGSIAGPSLEWFFEKPDRITKLRTRTAEIIASGDPRMELRRATK